MILDTFLEFADAADVSGSTGTAAYGAIDLRKAGTEPGTGHNIYLVIQVNQSFASAGAATVEFILASDGTLTGDTIATDGSATEHASTGKIPLGSLTAGERFVVALPFTMAEYERYLGILVRTGTAATTAGVIDAFLTTTPQQWKPYPAAVS